MLSILSHLRRPRRKAEDLVVTVYTRAACSCCEKAMAVLEAARARHGFAVETIDVDSDPALAAEYGTAVPVVAVGGKVRFRGLVNPALLERLLLAEGSGR